MHKLPVSNGCGNCLEQRFVLEGKNTRVEVGCQGDIGLKLGLKAYTRVKFLVCIPQVHVPFHCVSLVGTVILICLYPFLYQSVTHVGSSTCSQMTFSTFSANTVCHVTFCQCEASATADAFQQPPPRCPVIPLSSQVPTIHPTSNESMSLFTNKSCHYSVQIAFKGVPEPEEQPPWNFKGNAL